MPTSFHCAGVEIAHIATLLGYRGTVLVYNSTQQVDMEQIQDMLHSLEVTSILSAGLAVYTNRGLPHFTNLQ